MAKIDVKDLNSNITGSDLFSDSESFMRDLYDYELNTQGGSIITLATRIALLTLLLL